MVDENEIAQNTKKNNQPGWGMGGMEESDIYR